jgi:hypothetical protein
MQCFILDGFLRLFFMQLQHEKLPKVKLFNGGIFQAKNKEFAYSLLISVILLLNRRKAVIFAPTQASS